MKKALRKILVALLILSLLASNFVLAASYPLVFLDMSYGTKIPTNTVYPFVFTIFPEYKNEIIHINFYTEDGLRVAYCDYQFYNSSSASFEFTCTLDTTGYSGNYIVEYYMSFYTYYAWHDAPSKHTSKFTVVTPCANNAHSYDAGVITTTPTCAQTGVKTFTCTKCGATKTESLPVSGHTWDTGRVQTSATCTSAGTMKFTCTTCSTTRTETIPATGHTWGPGSVQYPASCTSAGTMLFTCTSCYQTRQETIPMTAHIWDNGVVILEPTWNQDGTILYTCTLCSTTKTRALGCSDPAACPTSHFTDVPGISDWAHKGIDYVVSHGLFNGTGATTFSPELTMTRAMLVTVMYRSAGSPTVESVVGFSDVPFGMYYTDAVAWAAENGVVNGMGNNLFAPDGTITREQMATILFRYANSNGMDTSARSDFNNFTDGATVSGYAVEAMSWAVATGLINGSGGKLMPRDGATRAQVATILMRFFQNPAIA